MICAGCFQVLSDVEPHAEECPDGEEIRWPTEDDIPTEHLSELREALARLLQTVENQSSLALAA